MTGEGSPSAGWWRSGNGEWYPPDMLPQGWSVGPDGVPRSFEWPAMPSGVRARSPWARLADSYRSWPVWAKLAPPVAALVLAGSAAAVFVLGDDDNDLDAVASTRTSVGANSTRRSTTVPISQPPVSVSGLVITAPPTVAATTVATTGNGSVVSAPTTTTRASAVAAPTSTLPPPTTVPPTVGATTTASTTTASTTTTLPTTTSVTTTTPTTTSVTTSAPTTTRVTTTTSTTTTRATTTTSTTTRAPVTHTVNGTVLVDSRMTVSGGCGGSGRFASFQNGQSIVLTGPTGQVVGQGVLTGCRWTEWRFMSGGLTAKPEFSFTMSGVVEVNSYTPRVASKTWPAVTLNAIRNAGWTLDLEVH